jgi:hypothetical protein
MRAVLIVFEISIVRIAAFVLLLCSSAYSGVDIHEVINFWYIHGDTHHRMRDFMQYWDKGMKENAKDLLLSNCGNDDACKGAVRDSPQKFADKIFQKFNTADWTSVEHTIGTFFNDSDKRDKLTEYLSNWNTGSPESALDRLLEGCDAEDCKARFRAAFRENTRKLSNMIHSRLDVPCSWSDLQKTVEIQRKDNTEPWKGFVNSLRGLPVTEKRVEGTVTVDTSTGSTGGGASVGTGKVPAANPFSFLRQHVLGKDWRSADNFGACNKADEKKFRSIVIGSVQ